MNSGERSEMGADRPRLSEAAEDAAIRAVRQLAASVFGSIDQADTWLETPNKVLSGATPASVLATSEGHRSVVSELKRIDYERG